MGMNLLQIQIFLLVEMIFFICIFREVKEHMKAAGIPVRED